MQQYFLKNSCLQDGSMETSLLVVKKLFRQPIDSFERRRNSLRAVGSNRFKALWCRVWQDGLWRFQTGVTKFKRFLPKNQHTQRKFLNWSLGQQDEIMQRALMWLNLSIWSSGCPTKGLKQAKNTKHAFFACFRPYFGQPDNHVGLAKLMPFASVYPVDPRTNP